MIPISVVDGDTFTTGGGEVKTHIGGKRKKLKMRERGRERGKEGGREGGREGSGQQWYRGERKIPLSSWVR